MDEPALIQAARAGDVNAMDVLLRRYQILLFHVVYSYLHHQQDTEDTAQLVMVKALQNLDHYEEQGKFKAWLMTIARREALRCLEQRRRRASSSPLDELEQMASGQTDESSHPAVRMERQERREQLQHWIKQLALAEQEVVRLRLGTGLTFREIAELTGVPLNTVLGRMHQATIKLKKLKMINETGKSDET
ncbi:MAG: sigma-70 family RNA polymerase sigma factor [Verrucomicrobiota bacterium]